MAAEFTLRGQAVRVTANIKQALVDALDVSAYDQADMILTRFGVEGTSPSGTPRIIGGMRTETEEGWVVLATGQAMSAAGSQKLAVTRLPKHIRWEMISSSGTGVSGRQLRRWRHVEAVLLMSLARAPRPRRTLRRVRAGLPVPWSGGAPDSLSLPSYPSERT